MMTARQQDRRHAHATSLLNESGLFGARAGKGSVFAVA